MTNKAKTKSDPLDVPVEEIPLPPDELTEVLDNSGQPEDGEPDEAPTPAPEVAELEFLSDPVTRCKVHPLAHPFRLNGERVKEISVKRLTVAEVGEVVRTAGKGLDFYDVYQAQTGLPAPVLRGLMDEDGDVVTTMCRDFFPRLLQAADG